MQKLSDVFNLSVSTEGGVAGLAFSRFDLTRPEHRFFRFKDKKGSCQSDGFPDGTSQKQSDCCYLV